MAKKADIGLIGLAVMGENLVLNMASKGFTVACYNRTVAKVDTFVQGRGKQKNIIGCHTLEELSAALKKGDIIIDGGNSHFPEIGRAHV